ncbi:MAG: flagellar biosynthesis protein FliQ [Planctomycetota bacterium]|nr:flagellar biosynthesis protein FliQ [Planctomycetota bacterium]
MSTSEAIDLGRQAVVLMLTVGAPVLIVGLVVALVVSIFQATTQLQDQTLSFIPKIVAMLIAMVIFGPWMFTKVLEFSCAMFGSPP